MLKPLFEFICDPSKIDFEDEILLAIKSLVKKSTSVSETIWVMVPFFPAVLEKNKHAFGNIMDTINHILLKGTDQLANKPEILRVFLTMSHTAMFS